jgi:hypothetical protein
MVAPVYDCECIEVQIIRARQQNGSKVKSKRVPRSEHADLQLKHQRANEECS